MVTPTRSWHTRLGLQYPYEIGGGSAWLSKLLSC